jgi:hypothetical protein
VKTELAISKMTEESGLQVAFTYFASKNATIK